MGYRPHGPSTALHTHHPVIAALHPGLSTDRALACLLLSLLAGLLLPGLVQGSELEPYSTRTTPAFSLPDVQDRERSLADYRGKVVLVNFWASWCAPCVYEMPALMRLQQRLQDQPFQILALNVGEKKYRVSKFVNLIRFDLPVLLDTSKEVFDAWGLETLPTSFLIDAEGRVRYRVRGDPGWNDADTLAVVEQLLSEATHDPADQSDLTDNEGQQ
jgi:thiol-disulfide isomerase/thioredoxin